MSQPNGIREKWIEFSENQLWKSEDNVIAFMGVENVADWFLSEFSTELNNLEEEILDIIQETDWIEQPKSAFGKLNKLLSLLEGMRNKYK